MQESKWFQIFYFGDVIGLSWNNYSFMAVQGQKLIIEKNIHGFHNKRKRVFKKLVINYSSYCK